MIPTKLGGKREAVASADRETAKIESPRNARASFWAVNYNQEPLKLLLKSPPEIKLDSYSWSLPCLTKCCGCLCAKGRAESCCERAGQVGGPQGQGARSQGLGGG